MNLIDAEVLEVLEGPKYHDTGAVQFWTVKVKFLDMGGAGETTLTFREKADADAVKHGYTFQH